MAASVVLVLALSVSACILCNFVLADPFFLDDDYPEIPRSRLARTAGEFKNQVVGRIMHDPRYTEEEVNMLMNSLVYARKVYL